jgi:hypothetical protein
MHCHRSRYVIASGARFASHVPRRSLLFTVMNLPKKKAQPLASTHANMKTAGQTFEPVRIMNENIARETANAPAVDTSRTIAENLLVALSAAFKVGPLAQDGGH